MKRPVAIVQARMGSTRLPGKILEDIAGQPLIVHQMRRMDLARTLRGVVVAIPDTPENDEIEALCREQKWSWFRGPEDDVLARYAGAARKFQADPVIRMTMDCPLIDPAVIDQVVQCYQAGKFDYVSNNLERTFPHGMDVECFSAKALREADRKATHPFDREHVTEWIRQHQDRPYRLGNLRFPLGTLDPARAAIMVAARLTVDYPEDLELARSIVEQDWPEDHVITMRDIVELLHDFPDLMRINEQRAVEHAQMLTGQFEPMSEAAVAERKRQILAEVSK